MITATEAHGAHWDARLTSRRLSPGEARLQIGGWAYENVKWTGEAWRVTSRGLRPVEPFRPEFILGKEAA